MHAIGNILRNAALPVHKVTEPNMKFNELRKINVTEKVEKKNGLSYLSWAWAVDTLLQHDPNATWEYKPHQTWNETVMVFCEVKAFGVSRTAQLPVMDHRNKAISEPDAFQVNTAMQRCLAKAISLHGIGLYIYAGEDLPEEAKEDPTDHLKIVSEAENMEDLKQAFTTAYKALKNNPEAIKQLDAAKEQRKKELTEIK
jgi:hypothetical protein